VPTHAPMRYFILSPLIVVMALLLAPVAALAGGPKYVAGTTFFNPGVLGQPVHWAGGQVSYYVDQGPLSDSVSNQQATAMVDAAAGAWSVVPTAGVTLTDKGPLKEDVRGANLLVNAGNQIAQPTDVSRSATNYPPAVYDRLILSTPSYPSFRCTRAEGWKHQILNRADF